MFPWEKLTVQVLPGIENFVERMGELLGYQKQRTSRLCKLVAPMDIIERDCWLPRYPLRDGQQNRGWQKVSFQDLTPKNSKNFMTLQKRQDHF